MTTAKQRKTENLYSWLAHLATLVAMIACYYWPNNATTAVIIDDRLSLWVMVIIIPIFLYLSLLSASDSRNTTKKYFEECFDDVKRLIMPYGFLQLASVIVYPVHSLLLVKLVGVWFILAYVIVLAGCRFKNLFCRVVGRNLISASLLLTALYILINWAF